jgi:hypothetical protein
MRRTRANRRSALATVRGRSRALPERSPWTVRLDDQQTEGAHGGTMGSPVLPRDCSSHRCLLARLNQPQAVFVEERFDGTPRLVNRQEVAVVREEWRVLDRWWTEEPISRRYFEVVLESGQNVVVFHDQERGGWFSQRGA